MEDQSISINLDEPLLAQQAVRDILMLPSEGSIPKIGFDRLLEVAKVSLRKELTACGCSEKELLGFRLEYQVLQDDTQEPRETYSVEWCQSFQAEEVSDLHEVALEAQPQLNSAENSISPEFAHQLSERLSERLDEALVEMSSLAVPEGSTITTSTYANFRSGISSFRYQCDPNCPKDGLGRERKRKFQKQGSEWIDKGCTTILCRISPRRQP